MTAVRRQSSRARDLASQNKLAAKAAGLRYVSDCDAGIRRVKISSGFAYVDTRGRRIHDEKILSRIKSLVIPPAWEDVWICVHPNGHLQAVGRDARGRKQYRYHPKWREARDQAKYLKLAAFAEALPKVRAAVRRHLALPGLPREKVLAAVIAIMEKTFIRVGNDEYASQNNSYGLTTLQDKHARVNGRKVTFEFRGKSGIEHEIDLEDPQLAKIVRKCRDLPGQDLFQYLDERGTVHDITSTDVNEYLRQISGGDFTAKDFRTWAGTVLAVQALQEMAPFTSQKQAKKNLIEAIDRVAERLGNTRAVCRKCYVHPIVLNLYLDGGLVEHLKQRDRSEVGRRLLRLPPDEAAVLMLLRKGA
jgi:DNA topoisomerase-1